MPLKEKNLQRLLFQPSLRWHLMQQGVNDKEIDKEIKKWELNRENVLASREAKRAEKKSSEATPDSEADKLAEDAVATEEEAAPDAETEESIEEVSSDNTGEEE